MNKEDPNSRGLITSSIGQINRERSNKNDNWQNSFVILQGKF
jgi:hypothetical protein